MTQIKNNALRITTESADRSWTGVAAAWANLNGTGTIALRDSQSTSSAVDNGTGDYTLNWSNDFASGNYNFCLSGYGDSSSNDNWIMAKNGTVPATTSIRLNCRDVVSAQDISYLCCAIFGSLA